MTDFTNPSGSKGLSVNLIPNFFKTDANKRFLQATVDQLVTPGTVKKVNGFVGRPYSKSTTGTDLFVEAVSPSRQHYQLEPSLTVQDTLGNNTFFKDYIDYINQLSVFGADTSNHARLNKQEMYSWNPHIDWDKFVNFQNYYWLSYGPDTIKIFGQQLTAQSTYKIAVEYEGQNNQYIFTPDGLTPNPAIKLYRGQTYQFIISSPSNPISIKTARSLGIADRYEVTGIDSYGVETGVITATIPVNSPNILYYQSETDINLGGIFEIYDIDENSYINVETEILGKANYTLSDGTALSNGMKVSFGGQVTPTEYATGEYYVEGVGTAIRLIEKSVLEISTTYTESETLLFDSNPFDVDAFSDSTGFAKTLDYTVVNRASRDHNPWSRYNRWFHKDVINASATFNKTIASLDQTLRAVRPIIEFNADLKLFNFGTDSIFDIDLIDSFTIDAFSIIEGSLGYSIDGVSLSEGQKILFLSDTDRLVKNKIFKVEFIDVKHLSSNSRQIHLVELHTPTTNEVILVKQGIANQGLMYWFDGTTWKLAQQKTNTNQFPLFDVVDNDGISFSDSNKYDGTTFVGTQLFSYKVNTTGTVDTNLGFALSYRNIENIGDIVFNFDFDIDTFSYKDVVTIVDVPINTGYLVTKDYAGNTIYNNTWEKCISPTQPAVRVYKNSNQFNNFKLDIFDDIDNLSDLVLRVYVNSKRLAKDHWSVITSSDYKVIKLKEDILSTDVLTIKAYASQPINKNGFYEIPLNLQHNPMNSKLSTLTLGEVIDHVDSIVDNIYMENSNKIEEIDYDLKTNLTFIGTFPGASNLRDLGNITQYGTKFVQHSGPASISLYHITTETNNVIRAMQESRDKYIQFKKNFLAVASTLGIETTPAKQVDLILEQINKDKSKTGPYYFSDMVPYRASTTTNITVVDSRIKTYPLKTSFTLDTLSTKSVLIYVNNVQLIYKKDYYFSDQGFVVIESTLAESDVISIVEYESTDGSFVPETPTKLGMWPKYEPKIYLDTTLVTPQLMIQGHDGSHVLAYHDYRDDIILELEKRIFNNIKVEYNTEIFDIAELLPSYNRPGDYSRKDFNQVLAPSFYQWATLVDRDFTKPLSFDRNNPFTFKYNSFSTPDGQEVPGYWRGIYQWIYDTDRPHLCPWEMLGFSLEPSWWQPLYGPAPYTSDNLVMWKDISEGFIRNPAVAAVQAKKYIKPFLLKHLPVDSSGKLVNPLVSGFVSGTITAHSQTDYVFGDVSPVESAWRRSSHYPFSVLLTAILLRPSDTFGKLLDRSRVVRNVCGQLIYKDTSVRITSADIKLPSIYSSTTRVQTSGIINYITNYILSDNLKSYTNYTYDLSYLNTKLSYRVGAFTSKEKFKLLLDSKSPLSTSSVFVPPEDYTVILNSSSPITKLTYSGVIVSKLSDGYEIKGYSRSSPYFKYYQYQQSGVTINIGGISENFVAWSANEQFGLGQVVKYSNQYFRVKVTHTTSDTFDKSLYEALPRLPVIGGRDAVIRKSWDKSVINTSPYGTKFAKIQEVVDFLLGYGEWLKDQGFIFDEFNPVLKAVSNWETSAKEFLFWTTQNWSNGEDKWKEWTPGTRITYGDIVRYNGDYFKANKNTTSDVFLENDFTKLNGLSSQGGAAISLSPSAAKLTFKTALSVIDDIRNPFNGYEIFKVDGTPLEPTFINSYREDNAVSYSPRGDDGIYGATFYLIQQEHVVLLNNNTIFNDTIFKPETGYKQDRIKVSGYVSADWYGGLDIPGFILDVAKIQSWTPWEDYDLGDIVKYKQFYYTASRFLPGTTSFVNDDWILLDKKPTTQLLPNWAYKAEQFTDFYSLDSDNFDTAQQKLAQHLIGYQKRQYLTNIIKDDVSEFKFYQGMIREKGTQNSLNKLFDVKSASGEESLTFYEEWAIRTGQYGASEAFESIEFVLDESKIRSNPQGFYLSENLDDPNDFIITYNSNAVYLKPAGYTANPWPVLKNYRPYLRSAGYVRSNEVYATLKSLDEILLKDPTDFKPNVFISVSFEGIGWNVYKYVEANVTVTNVEYSKIAKTLTFTLTELVDFSVGAYVGIDQVDLIKGFYKITSVSLNTFTVSATIATWSPPFTQSQNLVIFKFISQRSQTIDLVDSVTRSNLIPGDKLWIDSDANDKWAVWEYSPVYNRKTIANSSPINGGNYGKIISSTKLGKIIAIGSNTGDIEVWDKSGYNAQWIQRQLVTKPFIGYSDNSGKIATTVALSYDGQWLATGSPLAGNAYTNFKGEFSTNGSYDNNSIVYYNAGSLTDKYTGFYQNISGHTVLGPSITGPRPDGNPGVIPNITFWKKVKYAPTLLGGTSTGLSAHGVISLYSKDANNIFTLVDTIISPFPAENEQFGSQLEFANNALYVSAIGSNNNTGRIYKLKYSTDIQASAYYNPVGSSGTTLKIDSTTGILPGMLITGNGFTSGQIVSSVIDNKTLTISQQPDTIPTGAIAFSIVGWGFDFSATLNGDVEERHFGSSLAATDDDSTLIVSANNNELSGQVRIYKSGVLAQIITGTNLNFGKSIDISDSAAYLLISDSLADNEKPKAGIVNVYKFTESAYVKYQSLKNHNPENSGYFGSKVAFMDDYKTIAVYSSDEDTVLKTIFDTDSTIFDKESTNISQLAIESGKVDVYDMYDTKWIYSETLENLQSFGSGFGQAMVTGSNHIFVTAPFETDQGLQSGIVIDYEKKENSFSWTIKHQQVSIPDATKVKSAFLYNKATGKLLKYVDVIDLAQGKIAGPAREEIKYTSYYDPATYSINTSTDDLTVDADAPWGKSQVGYVWWDLRTTKLIDAYDNEVVYRNSVWNSLATGASVDLYEWVETTLLPAAWDAQADTEAGIANGISGKSLYGNDVYSIKERYDTGSQTKKYTYYYWVKNKKTIPNISGRNLSASDVASLIENPRGSAYTYLALTGTNSFSLVNAAEYLQDTNVVLSIEYWIVDDISQNIHSQWKLINTDSSTIIPTHIEQKWVDSLCGKDAIGRSVPDTTLPPKLQYGVENRPRQSMFVNRFEALKQLIEEANLVLLENPVVNNRNISNIDVKESVPSIVLGLYDTTQTTSEELRFVNVGAFRRPTFGSCTIVDGKITDVSITYAGRGYLIAPYFTISGSGEGAIIRAVLSNNGSGQIVGVTIINSGEGYTDNTIVTVRDYSVLVQSDSGAQGVWSIYSYDPDGKMWSRTKSQSYNVTDYWSKVDWYATGYNQFTAIDHAVDMVSDLKTLNDTVGQIIKVRTTSSGWSLLEKISNIDSFDYTQVYKVVGLENGTIQLSSSLYSSLETVTGYDGTTYDGIAFDNSPNLELRIILQSLKNDIFIDELKIKYLNLFFTTVRYALSEQVYLDWIFKTSFIKARHNVGKLSTPVTYNNDNLTNFQDYISEVKPFKSKIREYVSSYQLVDANANMVSDFDLPPIYRNNAVTTITTNAPHGTITADDATIRQYPWKNWLDNVGFIVTDIQIISGGSGYINEPVVKIISDSGSGATARAFFTNGVINRIILLTYGSGYLSAPQVTITGGLSATGVAARAVAIIGNSVATNKHHGVIRTSLIKIKFDRTTSSYFFINLEETEYFNTTGNLQYKLTYAPDVIIGNSTVTINDVPVLRENYKLTTVTTKTDYTKYSGLLTFEAGTQPAVGQTIKIVYLKNQSLLNAADRIYHYYNPQDGDIGKDLSQLMTGVDYGGAIIQGLGFDISAGWGTTPWFTDKWDSFDPSFDDYIVTVAANTHSFTLPYTPTTGTKINTYYVGLNLTTIPVTTGVLTYPYTYIGTNPTATLTRNVLEGGVTSNYLPDTIFNASSVVIKVVSVAGITAGMTVIGTGFASKQTVLLTNPSLNTVTLSAPPNTQPNGTLYFTKSVAGSTTLSLSSTVGLRVGDTVATTAASCFGVDTVIKTIVNSTEIILNQIIYITVPTASSIVFTRALNKHTDITIANGIINLTNSFITGSSINITSTLPSIKLDDEQFGTPQQTNTNAIVSTFVGNGNSNTITIPNTFAVSAGDKFILRKSTSDGSIAPQDTDYDSIITGGDMSYSTASGLAADDILIDGDGFVTPTSSPAPEEVIPGQVVDAVAIKVYDQPNSGAANIRVDNFIGDSIITVFKMSQTPNSVESVIIKKSNVILNSNQYTIDYRTREITLLSAPAAGEIVSIYNIGFNGNNILDIDYFVGDGTTTEFITKAPWLSAVTSIVYVDGVVATPVLFQTDSTYETTNRVALRFPVAPSANALINYVIVSGNQQTFAITKKEKLVTNGASSYELAYPIGNNLPAEANMIVRVNQTILPSPVSSYFTIKNNKLSYKVDPAKIVPYSTPITNILVIVGTEVLKLGTDYTVDPGGLTIKINKITYSTHVNKTLVVSINSSQGYTYDSINNQIIFSQSYTSNDVVEVISSYSHDILDIQRTAVTISTNLSITQNSAEYYTYKESLSGLIALDRTVISDEYVWVVKNGTLLVPSVDYKLNDNKQSIQLEARPAISDIITLITFGNNVLGSTISYMQFKDMLNRIHFKRLSRNKQTRLASPLRFNDTSILVTSSANFDAPNASINRPGIVEINGERIEFFEMVGNRLSKLRRGTLGTGIPLEHRSGTFVQDIGPSETLPYNESSIIQQVESDGSSIINLNFVPTKTVEMATDFTIGRQYKIVTLGTTDWNIVANTKGIIYAIDSIVTVINTPSGDGTGISMSYGQCDEIEVFIGGYNIDTVWTANTAYTAGTLVISGSYTYRAISSHTSSSTFKQDYDLGRWKLFVGNTRLKKKPYKVHHELQSSVASNNPSNFDQLLDAEFTVDGTSAAIRLTTPVEVGVKVTVVKRMGTDWDSTLNIQYDSGAITEFLKATPGIWYTEP